MPLRGTKEHENQQDKKVPPIGSFYPLSLRERVRVRVGLFSGKRRFCFLITCIITILLLATLSACGTPKSAEKTPVIPDYGKIISEDVPLINPIFSKTMDTGIINSLAMSQDGQYLAIGLRDSVWLWDTINRGRDKKILQSSGIRDVTAIRFSQGETGGTCDLRVKPVSDRKESDLTWDVSLKRGANMITVVARDSDNLVTRKSLEINYTEERGDIWAVVIGVSQYKHIEGLKFADNDARAFYNYLIADNAIPADHVILLTNEDATLQRVKDVLGVEIMHIHTAHVKYGYTLKEIADHLRIHYTTVSKAMSGFEKK